MQSLMPYVLATITAGLIAGSAYAVDPSHGMSTEAVLGIIGTASVAVGGAMWKVGSKLGAYFGEKIDRLVDGLLGVFKKQSEFVDKSSEIMEDLQNGMMPLLDKLEQNAEHMKEIARHFRDCPYKNRILEHRPEGKES